VLLWILVIGFAGLALWKLVQAAVARLNPTEGHRLRAAGSAVGYFIAFGSTYWFVRDGRVPASSDSVSRDLTATVMSYDGGQLIVAIAGLLIALAGIYMATEPFGPILLIVVALGLIAFGILSFFEAKWRRTFGGVPV
jgi:Domain of Unknown Function (DUF1206)